MQQDTGFLQYLLVRAIDIYAFMIIVRVIMSWFISNPSNAIYRFLIQMTEPFLGRIRRLLPRSGLDFSPLIAIILLEILSSIIMGM
jgi:YggT family protein